jgi:sec-independent protein translocase protein TatB
MLGMGLGELLVIGVVLLLVVGPDRLPQFMRTAGRVYGQVRRASDDLRRSFTAEADRVEAEDRFQRLQERRKQVEEDRKKALESAGAGAVAQLPGDESPPSTGVSQADADPETPAPTVDLPPGVSAEEWMRLPPHIQRLLRSDEESREESS